MTAVDIAVYQPNGTTLIAHVPRRRGVKWQDELNTPGVGSFQLHLDDPILTAQPTLLDEFNVVRVSIGGTPVKAWVIESLERANVAEGSDRWVTVSGRGVLSVLGNAVVYSEYATIRRNSADARSFDFGSKDGGWRVTSDWHTPYGVRQDASTTRRGYPMHWPDPSAQWLWSSNPDSNSAPGTNYFRGSFNLTSAARVTIYAAGDNAVILQLDGEPIIQQGNHWHYTAAWTGDLQSGSHLIAAAVTNYASATGGNNPAGFLCAVAIVDRANRIQQIRMRSTPASFKVRGYGSPPGWFGPSILKTLVTEAQTRGVEGLTAVTFGFSDTLDTSGAAWTGRQDRSFEIGTRDLLDVLAQLSEVDFDVDMTPTMQLRAWKQRGTDRRASVALTPGASVLEQTASSTATRIKTRALVRHGRGWIEYVDTTAAASYGRRETGLVVGNTQSDSQAQTFSQAAFNDLGKPEVTLPVTTTSAVGPQPYTDYDLGDIITAPGLLGAPAAARLMSLSVEENDNLLTFAHELYPES